MLYLTDLIVPEGVEIPELAQDVEQSQPIVSIHVVKEVIIEEEVEEEVVEGEEGEEVEGEEGEAAADGEAPTESDDKKSADES